jgi:two-component system, LytTR family, sensor kinase
MAVVMRLELMRQGVSGKGPTVEVLLLCCLLLYPVLCALTWLSWRAGYDTSRWLKLVLINVGLACAFGLASRPSFIVANALDGGVSLAESHLKLDGRNVGKAAKLWASSFVEDAALYLMLQGILLGANAFVRLKDESAQRDRLAHDYDRARLQSLRMQTNPHFLFNTLSAIAGLINSRPAAAQSMVTQLGELFRATLEERDSELVTLQRELELGRQYLEIQCTRFDSRFAYSIDLQADASDIAIPPLLLQPLLENAAEHGLTSQDGSVLVQVEVSCDAMLAQIVIRNRAAPEADAPRSRSHRAFGLELVRERVRAAFGESASLDTGLTQDGTFQASLRFPFQRLAAAA